MTTCDSNSCAYGCDDEQPGSSMNIAVWPGSIQFLKRMMCSLFVLLSASPFASEPPLIVCEISPLNGAKSPVTYPPLPTAGRPHEYVTKPEQSERYAFHAELLSRSQRWLGPSHPQHAVSPS